MVVSYWAISAVKRTFLLKSIIIAIPFANFYVFLPEKTQYNILKVIK